MCLLCFKSMAWFPVAEFNKRPKNTAVVKLSERNDEHGYAILEADADLPYLEPFRSTARSSAGVEIKLVLETIIHLGGKWANLFNDDFPAFVPIQRPPLLSLNWRYLYFGTGCMGHRCRCYSQRGAARSAYWKRRESQGAAQSDESSGGTR
jgi:hypothetical protein